VASSSLTRRRVPKIKFTVPDEDVQEFRREPLGFCKHVAPAEVLDAVLGDKAGNRILECAVAAGSESVVTGNTDLISLGSFRGIQIQRVGDFETPSGFAVCTYICYAASVSEGAA
jgi:predicted nucleic acid-binding protein